MRRTRWEARNDKCRAMGKADAAGLCADGMEYRMALMARVKSGEISLEAAQAELKRVKRQAKRDGVLTREEAYRNG